MAVATEEKKRAKKAVRDKEIVENQIHMLLSLKNPIPLRLLKYFFRGAAHLGVVNGVLRELDVEGCISIENGYVFRTR